MKIHCQTFIYPPTDFNSSLDVAGCFCVCRSKILMVKRHPDKPQGNTWGLPSGKVEKGEKIRNAVLRELFEETGISLKRDDLQDIGKMYVRHTNLDFVYHMYCGALLLFPELTLQEDECIDARWLTVEEALNLDLIAGGEEVLNYFSRMFRQ